MAMDASKKVSDIKSEVQQHFIELKNALIMMVDDEPIMMELVQVFLESEGYSRFIIQPDSSMAIEQLESLRPDILLLDLNMPRVSGFDILQAIGEREHLVHIPVIMLTSSTDPADKLKALELGATDFLAKPVDPSELALRVRNTLTVKAYQDQLAYYDNLTGLPNRALFLDRLELALSRYTDEGGTLAVVDIGLDRFKHVNQSLGINSGDDLLKQVASRILDRVREDDVMSKVGTEGLWRNLSRLGGDEFSILLNGLESVEEVEVVVRRIRKVFNTPFDLSGSEVLITASMGVAVFPVDGTNADQLVKRAGAASAFVKREGGNNHHFFSEEIDARSRDRLKLETDLQRAIGRDELEMYYQPKVCGKTHKFQGVEALIRWNHHELGMISPVVFIPLAEEIGFLRSIGDWVIYDVCHQISLWRERGLPDFTVSINVSPQQLQRGDLVGTVASAIERNGIDPACLVIEVTESLAMEDSARNSDLLNRLKALGVSLSIDDFGTGYSSLINLKRLPFDELKIDRSFLVNVPADKDDVSIVTAIVAMAKSLNLRVVAEGVEELEQLEFLSELQCDTIQGFYFSRPFAADRVEAFIEGNLDL